MLVLRKNFHTMDSFFAGVFVCFLILGLLLLIPSSLERNNTESKRRADDQRNQTFGQTSASTVASNSVSATGGTTAMSAINGFIDDPLTHAKLKHGPWMLFGSIEPYIPQSKGLSQESYQLICAIAAVAADEAEIHFNRQLRTEAFFDHDKPAGTWSCYVQDHLVLELPFKYGQLDSTCVSYDLDGSEISRLKYKNGLLDGLSTEKHKHVAEFHLYRQGVRVKHFAIYTVDLLRDLAGIDLVSEANGADSSWRATGAFTEREPISKAACRDGKWTIVGPLDLHLIAMPIPSPDIDMINAVAQDIKEKGRRDTSGVRTEAYYDKGIPTGTWKTYVDDELFLTIPFQDGRVHGVTRTYLHSAYFETGSAEYKHGILHGFVKSYDSHGRLLIAKRFENAVPHGLSFEIDYDEGLITKQTYDHGTVINQSTERFDISEDADALVVRLLKG